MIAESDDPVECLVFGQGDVAFVPYSALHKTGEWQNYGIQDE